VVLSIKWTHWSGYRLPINFHAGRLDCLPGRELGSCGLVALFRLGRKRHQCPDAPLVGDRRLKLGSFKWSDTVKKLVLILIALGVGGAAIIGITDDSNLYSAGGTRLYTNQKERSAYERIGRQYDPNSSDPAAAGLRACLYIHDYNSTADAMDSGALPKFPLYAGRIYDPGCPNYGIGLDQLWKKMHVRI
jgi:hypothetical protein